MFFFFYFYFLLPNTNISTFCSLYFQSSLSLRIIISHHISQISNLFESKWREQQQINPIGVSIIRAYCTRKDERDKNVIYASFLALYLVVYMVKMIQNSIYGADGHKLWWRYLSI